MARPDALPLPPTRLLDTLRRLGRPDTAPADAGGPPSPLPGLTHRGDLGADGEATASWHTEQQVRQVQALLRTAAAAGRLGAWSIDLHAGTWLWSEEVRAIHEVPAGFVPSLRAALPLYTADSRAAFDRALALCTARGTPFDLELQLATPAGREVWIHVLGEAERATGDGITHVRGAMQDVSRFRAVADEARRTAERLAQTLEQLTDGFLLLDHEWRFVYVNPRAEAILRRPRAQLVGRSLLVEFPETAAGRFLERCEHAVREGRSVEFERYYGPLGIWMHMKVWPSDQGLTICIHDDTERINARRENLMLKAQLDALRAAQPAAAR